MVHHVDLGFFKIWFLCLELAKCTDASACSRGTHVLAGSLSRLTAFTKKCKYLEGINPRIFRPLFLPGTFTRVSSEIFIYRHMTNSGRGSAAIEDALGGTMTSRLSLV